jgi:tagatose 1,6-diphosphate aldolase
VLLLGLSENEHENEHEHEDEWREAMATLPAGKLRNLLTLGDETGRLKMMAIDQRMSMERTLEAVLGRRPRYEETVRVKRAVTAALAPYATAVLIDAEFGYSECLLSLPGNVGLLMAVERPSFDAAGPEGRERRSGLIDGWSVEKARRAGANAIKLLLFYRPDASAETNEFQQRIAREVGEECARLELPFLLELLGYPLGETAADTPEYARRKPEIVIESAREFSRPEYGVDLLKLEFPADLKYCYELSRRQFDTVEREPAYDLPEVRAHCRALDEASAVPWVILSAGVGIAEFLVNIELASGAGASGFLCGRAIWQSAAPLVRDEAAMLAHLEEEGAINFLRANAAAEACQPWFDHRKFGGWEKLAVAGASPSWYREY